MSPHQAPDITEATSSSVELVAIRQALFNNAMNGNWEKVVKTYSEVLIARQVKITKSGDTAIHVAVADGQEAIVKELVSWVKPADLEIKNELGNTPLHQAAILGNVNMCRCIADKDSKLMGITNKDNETPFFLAVLHGKKDVFHCLHSLCKNREGYKYCRRKDDGDTILHAAITGEYFALAFEIIHHYKELINSVNEEGISPLHLLANKPTAFRSGSHVSGFRKLIYHRIFVDELKPHPSNHILSDDLQYDPDEAFYPENYHTCVGLIHFLRKIFKILTGTESQQNDTENPKENQSASKQVHKNNPQDHAGSPNEKQTVTKQDGSSDSVDKQGAYAEGEPSDIEREKRSKILRKAQEHQSFPENYRACFDVLKLLSKTVMIIFGLVHIWQGSTEVKKIREEKEKHMWSVQILKELLETANLYGYEDTGRTPFDLLHARDGETTPYDLDEGGETENALDWDKKETPILIAAKNGIMEIVKLIYALFPMAIHDMNSDKKNIVLLAVEHRQPHVYQYLLMHKMREAIFRKTDKDGNSALHLAAKRTDLQPGPMPGAALQLQWEIKWFQFVKHSMPLHFYVRYNKKGETPEDILMGTHEDLITRGGEWLTRTSESWSAVAVLIATVAFATSSTIPGGTKQDTGIPNQEANPIFGVFAISYPIALCFSVLSIMMFLSIRTNSYKMKDFEMALPRQLLLGMTSLFISMAAMLVSFFSGHFFVLKDKWQLAAFSLYAMATLPVGFFAIAQFPLYYSVAKSIFSTVPQRYL